MTEVQHVTEVAKGISDYGMMAVSAAFFLFAFSSYDDSTIQMV